MKKRFIFAGAVIAAAAAVALVAAKRDDHEFKVSKNLDIFFSVFKELNLNYVEQPDPDRLVPAAISSMLQQVDPYTVYIPEEDREEYQFSIDGEYGGIGCVIALSDTNLIGAREIYRDTPSHKAGLKVGDRFLSIDGESMRGKDVTYVRSKLRGKPGTVVRCVVERPGAPKPVNVDITREIVKIETVEYYGMIDNEVGYILLRSFETGCADAVRKAFLDLRDNKGAKKVILDLRGNSGGLLDESLQIVNLFVPKGSAILETRGRRRTLTLTHTAKREPVDTIMPLVVMINRGSASASEIVAGALQDLDRAVITGQRSFGKGLVQATREVSFNGLLKVTTAKYYTPSGRCIQAIDYSSRDENGAVSYVPDSLITEYKTRGGRPVYDGGGISPDVLLDADKFSQVTIALSYYDLVFRFIASTLDNGNLPPFGADGHLTDETFDKFVAFIKENKDFKYTSAAQNAYEKLVAAAKQEGAYEADKDKFEALRQTCTADVERDIRRAKSEIAPMIEEETVRATKMRREAIGYSLQYDKQLTETVKLMHDADRFDGLLSGTVASHAGDKRASSRGN